MVWKGWDDERPGLGGALLILHDVVAHDGLVTSGADTDVGDAAAGELFQAQNVILSLLRELLEGLAASDVLVPGRHGLKDGLGVVLSLIHI